VRFPELSKAAGRAKLVKESKNMTDPIADMLTRVRNAVQGKHQKVDMPASRLKTEIARILKEEGYIAHYKTAEEEGKNFLTLFLKYGPKGEKVISKI
jgi:small subunit ribosomal protein S8